VAKEATVTPPVAWQRLGAPAPDWRDERVEFVTVSSQAESSSGEGLPLRSRLMVVEREKAVTAADQAAVLERKEASPVVGLKPAASAVVAAAVVAVVGNIHIAVAGAESGQAVVVDTSVQVLAEVGNIAVVLAVEQVRVGSAQHTAVVQQVDRNAAVVAEQGRHEWESA
jgi:hypothetical protein